MTLPDHQTGRKVLNLNAKLPLSIQTTDEGSSSSSSNNRTNCPPLKFKHEIFDTNYDFIEKKIWVLLPAVRKSSRVQRGWAPPVSCRCLINQNCQRTAWSKRRIVPENRKEENSRGAPAISFLSLERKEGDTVNQMGLCRWRRRRWAMYQKEKRERERRAMDTHFILLPYNVLYSWPGTHRVASHCVCTRRSSRGGGRLAEFIYWGKTGHPLPLSSLEAPSVSVLCCAYLAGHSVTHSTQCLSPFLSVHRRRRTRQIWVQLNSGQEHHHQTPPKTAAWIMAIFSAAAAVVAAIFVWPMINLVTIQCP